MLEFNVTVSFPAAPLLTVILALVGKCLILCAKKTKKKIRKIINFPANEDGTGEKAIVFNSMPCACENFFCIFFYCYNYFNVFL